MKEIIIATVALIFGFVGAQFFPGISLFPPSEDSAGIQEEEQLAGVGDAVDEKMITPETLEIEVTSKTPKPEVKLEVVEDSSEGLNAHVMLKNFKFVPAKEGGEYVPGEGHAHLYVDGLKVGRVYGEWHYVGELALGTHDVLVRLTSSDHKELTLGGAFIEATTTVEILEKAVEAVEEATSTEIDEAPKGAEETVEE